MPRLRRTPTPQRVPTATRAAAPRTRSFYQTIDEHWAAFSERLEQHGGLPRLVEREFEEYLKCGILDFGFLELECRQCGHTELCALSCKRRGLPELPRPANERLRCPSRALRPARSAHPSLDL